MFRLPLECSVCHIQLEPIEAFGLPQAPLCRTHYLPPLDTDPRAVQLQQEIDQLQREYDDYEREKDYIQEKQERIERWIEDKERELRYLSPVLTEEPRLAVKLIIQGK